MKFKLFFICSLLLYSFYSIAGIKVHRVAPSNWFINMNNPHLQLLVKGEDWTNVNVSCNYPGVVIKQTKVQENPKYIVLDIELTDELKAGTAPFHFKKGNKKYILNYLFKAKEADFSHMGLSPKDNIYLITPDRFANGDESNDIIQTMKENTIDRKGEHKRHGGDLKGIIDHIDYLKDLGVTALWLNPVFENNQEYDSYHGYAITDHYAIDARLGDLSVYKDLVDKLHSKNMKIIKDVVFNHFGSNHYLVTDLPSSDWINKWDSHTSSNFRATTIFDPYAAQEDKVLFQNGWFDRHMPDMNQQNPVLANYLIQNSIWWIETFGIDAYRIDTYAYSDQKFMAKWAAAIMNEYPNFFLFGETWVHGPIIQSYFTDQSTTPRPFKSNLNSVTDFQLYYAINKSVTEPFDWAKGISNVYYTLVNDIIYRNPENLVTFLDNHDLARFYGAADKDLQKFKMGYGMLFTLRGIPQILYGSEVLMAETESHGKIREDFSGGWKSDPVNKFVAENRTSKENEAFDFIKKLMHWRSNSNAVTQGKLIQFVPEKGMYVYLRVHKNNNVLVVVNANKEKQTIKLDRFKSYLPSGSSEVLNVIEDKKQILSDSLSLSPFDIHIFEYNK